MNTLVANDSVGSRNNSVMIFGGVSRYVREEQQNKQPMVGHTVIIDLG